ncbi:MAG: DUF1553 domain-containing protein [Verrucomicrobia bacterium]|nr:DUF1553 domain-containing protein [Verrucomicrobiota bacterium]
MALCLSAAVFLFGSVLHAASLPHWAYQKPVRPAIPPGANAIDHFIQARLRKEGLTPSPEATRETLIRRVSLDLTGLPPTPAEVEAFLADNSPNAYERVVDRLLASPAYGERWARPWLDLARYADTQGYEKDNRRTMWPYRDWVINALNADMPFDRFTLEQFAGDLLPNATRDQKIATGFHRNTMTNTEGGTDNEEYRHVAVVDRVNTTMQVWQGQTFGCAQCHDHKYDPFTTKEYYRLYAFLNSTADADTDDDAPVLRMPTPEQAAALKAVRAEVAAAEKAKAPAAELKKLKAKEAALVKTISSTLVMEELPKPRETHLFTRGNFLTPGEVVQAGVPAVLNPLPANAPTSRLTLARWLLDENNPLTARVAMNRAWEQFFGAGIVATSEDFGTRGERPSHPELLDWLATEFVARKWSMKAMHKLIVMSATYRQASRVTPQLLERDPYNRLLARGPRIRLDAEMLRDQALAVSGLLCRKIGGPSVMPPQPDGLWQIVYSGDTWKTSAGEEKYRRGLYTFWRRSVPYPLMTTFDAPTREFCVVRRNRSNTPLQALNLMNDPAFVECAQALARRMIVEGGSTPEARATLGVRLCLARQPKASEVERLVALYRDELERYRTDADAAKTVGGADAETAAWTVVANVLLNLDEFITKG